MSRYRALAGLLLLLGACSAAESALIQGGVKKIQDAKDTEALTLKAGLCAMSVGAKNRQFNTAERQYIEGLCYGDAKPTITMESLRELGGILQNLQPPE